MVTRQPQHLWIFGILMAVLGYHSATAQAPLEKGVSYNLAIWRKQLLSQIEYQLHFTIPADTQSVAAHEHLSFQLTDAKEDLPLDFKPLKAQIDFFSLNGHNLQPNLKQEHLLLPKQWLKRGKNEVDIGFISNGKPLKRGIPNLVYCLFVPAKARETFPCFDQPDLKARFSLSLTLPESWTAISNGAQNESALRYADNHMLGFETTSPISTYLFSFAAGNYKSYTATSHGKPIHFFYQESDTAKLQANLAVCMDLNKKALDFNTSYLGVPYPFAKFDFVEIPRFSLGGMEHPGSIFFGGDVLFLDKPDDTRKYGRAVTIGHEVSHMWFGDLVTMKWFNEVWLKEVFASFLGNKFAATQVKNTDFNSAFLLANFPNAFLNDRLPSADAISRPLPNLNQAGLAYGEASYNKAPIMMRQLELLLGPGNFQKGVRDYIRKYQGGNADFKQLIACLQPYTKTNLDQWTEQWVRRAGRPLFYCTIDQQKDMLNSIELSQFGEFESGRNWMQQFSIGLYYDSTHIDTIRVHMHAQKERLVLHKKMPKYILFNTTGEGYGVFPVDPSYLHDALKAAPVTARAAAVINMYERTLRLNRVEYQSGDWGQKLKPLELMNLLLELAAWEPNRQLLDRELRYIEFIYWRLLRPGTRAGLGGSIERGLWSAMQSQADSVKAKAIFWSYIRTAESKTVFDSLYTYWKDKRLPTRIDFAKSDWNGLTQEIALRNYPGSMDMLNKQLEAITDASTRQSFQYQMAALSSDQIVRDSLFRSLQYDTGRRVEADVQQALRFLHHPLRHGTTLAYIEPTLAWLPDVFEKNDIFFPANWVAASFETYQEPEVAQLLRKYLSEDHPDVPPLLQNRVRLAAEAIERMANVAE